MEKVFLDKHDEITDALDKIKAVKSTEIYLAIPGDSLMVQGSTSFKLLKSFARRVGKKISISSSDVAVRRMAEKAGLSVVGAIKRSQVVRGATLGSDGIATISIEGKRGKRAVGVKNYRDVKKVSIAARAEKNDGESKGHQSPSSRLKTCKNIGNGFGWRGWVIVIIVVLVGLSAAYLLLPRAEIQVSPRQEEFSSIASFTVDKGVSETDVDTKKIPGQVVEIEKEVTESYEATGEKNIGKKATGTITVYNIYQTTSRQISGARFQNSDGNVYIATKAFIVPGYEDTGDEIIPGEVEVAVEAENGGESYNIDPATFTIVTLSSNLQDKIYGRSFDKFSGGTDENVKAVSVNDLENAKNETENKALAGLIDELEDSWGEKYYLDESAREVTVEEEGANKKEDDEADNFDYKVKSKLKALVFAYEDVQPIVDDKVAFMLSEDWNVSESSGEEAYEVRSVDLDVGRASVFMHVSRNAVHQINTGDIIRRIKNVEAGAAKDAIKNDLQAEDVKISLWPFWVSKVPRFEWRINILIK